MTPTLSKLSEDGVVEPTLTPAVRWGGLAIALPLLVVYHVAVGLVYVGGRVLALILPGRFR